MTELIYHGPSGFVTFMGFDTNEDMPIIEARSVIIDVENFDIYKKTWIDQLQIFMDFEKNIPSNSYNLNIIDKLHQELEASAKYEQDLYSSNYEKIKKYAKERNKNALNFQSWVTNILNPYIKFLEASTSSKIATASTALSKEQELAKQVYIESMIKILDIENMLYDVQRSSGRVISTGKISVTETFVQQFCFVETDDVILTYEAND